MIRGFSNVFCFGAYHNGLLDHNLGQIREKCKTIYEGSQGRKAEM
jgi:hypothetical protein